MDCSVVSKVDTYKADNESQTGLDHRDTGVRYGHDLSWPLPIPC